MAWRFAGRCESQIDDIVLESARRWGIEAAARYNRLIFAAIEAIGDSPAFPGARPIPEIEGILSLHLRFARRLLPREHRVREPHHVVIYRQSRDGIVEILGLVHDRQLLDRAARRAKREADG